MTKAPKACAYCKHRITDTIQIRYPNGEVLFRVQDVCCNPEIFKSGYGCYRIILDEIPNHGLPMNSNIKLKDFVMLQEIF